MFKALEPAELELALGDLQELETRDQAMMRQWQMRLERAEYEAALAERRYEVVDPSNRLVASTWSTAGTMPCFGARLKKQAAEFQQQKARVVGCSLRACRMARLRFSSTETVMPVPRVSLITRKLFAEFVGVIRSRRQPLRVRRS